MYNDKKMRAFEYISIIILIASLKLGYGKTSEYAELALYIVYCVNLFFGTMLQIRLSYGSVRKRYDSVVNGDLKKYFYREIKLKYHILYLIATVVIIMFFNKVIQSSDLANLKLFNFLIFVMIGRTLKDIGKKAEKKESDEEEN